MPQFTNTGTPNQGNGDPLRTMAVKFNILVQDVLNIFNQISVISTNAANISTLQTDVNSLKTRINDNIGNIVYFGSGTVPSHGLLCDGSEVSQTTYGALFGVIGTTYNDGTEGAGNFRLPDTRGVFLRGVDNGRGFDPGRALGSFQDHAIERMQGEISSQINSRIGNGSGVFEGTPTDIVGNYAASFNVTDPSGIVFDSANVVNSADETRPKNLAATCYIVATGV